MVRKWFKQQCTRNLEEGNPKIISALYMYGMEILNECLANKETRNITLNQADSYAGAVYYKGKRKKSIYPYQGYYRGDARAAKRLGFRSGYKAISMQKASESNLGISGIEAAQKAIRSHSPMSDGYELFLTNGMPYSAWQQFGTGPYVGSGKRWRIIEKSLSKTWQRLQMIFSGNGVWVSVRSGVGIGRW